MSQHGAHPSPRAQSLIGQAKRLVLGAAMSASIARTHYHEAGTTANAWAKTDKANASLSLRISKGAKLMYIPVNFIGEHPAAEAAAEILQWLREEGIDPGDGVGHVEPRQAVASATLRAARQAEIPSLLAEVADFLERRGKPGLAGHYREILAQACGEEGARLRRRMAGEGPGAV